MTPEAADLGAWGARPEGQWGQFKPGTGMSGTDRSPPPNAVSLLSPAQVLCRYPYPTISCVGRCMDSSNLFAFCVA